MRRSIICLLTLFAGAMPASAAEQSTVRSCSPIQSGDHNTFICNGVDPRVMKRLNDDLDRMDFNLQQKTAEANEWARRYNELNAQFEETKKQLAAKGEDPTLVQTAQDLLHQGRLDEARKIYDRLIVSDEGNVDRAAQDYFDRASILQLQFRMLEAMADYGKAVQYRPDNPRYADGFGRFAYQERDYAKAENGWTAVLQRSRELAARDPGAYRPSVAATLNNLGNLHSDTGRLAEAEKD